MHVFSKFGSQSSYGNRNIISYISSCMNTLEKIAPTALVHHFENFQNHEYQQLIPDTNGEKNRQQEEEHRELQSVTCSTQTQK